MKNKKVAFIDIEANQIKKNIYMLEFSIFNSESDSIMKFVECQQKSPLNTEVSELLKKHKYYYKNKQISEKQAYLELIELSKTYELVCFGNYDQTILDAIQRRYKLERIKLTDFLEELSLIFNIDKNRTPSLNNFKNICEIDWNEENDHNSYWDAKYLKDVYLKINSNKNNPNFIDSYKKRLIVELLRPKNHKFKDSRVKKAITRFPYKTIFLNYKRIQELDKENPKHLIELKVDIYNLENKLIKSFKQIVVNKEAKTISDENLKLILNTVLKNQNKYTKNLFIFNGKRFWNKLFLIENRLNTYWLINKITTENFNKVKLNNELKFELIKSFYENGNFNKKVDYKKIIKKFNI